MERNAMSQGQPATEIEYRDQVLTVEPHGIEQVVVGERHGKTRTLFSLWLSANMGLPVWLIGAILLAIIFVIMTVIGLPQAHFGLTSQLPLADHVGLFVLMTTAVASYVFSWSPYASDYARYLPATTSMWAVFWAVFAGSFIG